MSTVEELSAQLFRLVHLARSIAMKRALVAVEPEPKLNFWRLVQGNQLDVAVLEWCKVFGSHAEATHWQNVVPATEHDQYRTALFASLAVNAGEWSNYWEEMKGYRDNLVAHHIEAAKVPKYPHLELALKSSVFHYKYVIGRLRTLGESRYPNDLQAYYDAFTAQAQEIAKVSTTASSSIEERVD